jgi:hypothetical protein
VGDILVLAAEFTQIPARQSDEEPLAKLLAQLRQEVDIKVGTTVLEAYLAWPCLVTPRISRSQNPMFMKMHPALKKAAVLLAAQVRTPHLCPAVDGRCADPLVCACR